MVKQNWSICVETTLESVVDDIITIVQIFVVNGNALLFNLSRFSFYFNVLVIKRNGVQFTFRHTFSVNKM